MNGDILTFITKTSYISHSAAGWCLTNRQTDRQVERQTHSWCAGRRSAELNCFSPSTASVAVRERQTGSETGSQYRQTDRQVISKDRQTGLTLCFILAQLARLSLQRLWMVTLQAEGQTDRERQTVIRRLIQLYRDLLIYTHDQINNFAVEQFVSKLQLTGRTSERCNVIGPSMT